MICVNIDITKPLLSSATIPGNGLLDWFVIWYEDFSMGCAFCGSENHVLEDFPLVKPPKKEIQIIIQKNPTHQRMIAESLTKAARSDNQESGAEQATNWIHVTPRAKAKCNININNPSSSKNQQMKGKGAMLRKGPNVTDVPHVDTVVSLITSSLEAVSMSTIKVSAVVKQKIVEYMSCDVNKYTCGMHDFNQLWRQNPLMLW